MNRERPPFHAESHSTVGGSPIGANPQRDARFLVLNGSSPRELVLAVGRSVFLAGTPELLLRAMHAEVSHRAELICIPTAVMGASRIGGWP